MMTKSAVLAMGRDASRRSFVVVTSTRLIPAGIGTTPGPQMTSTEAPRSSAACASAAPILPELALPMKRTASMGSRVPPAVISTRLPFRGWSCCAENNAFRKERMSSVSAILPSPTARQASCPCRVGMNLMPRSIKMATFACVAGCSHICVFIAGLTTTGTVAARQVADTMSLHKPCARFARVFADAGAIKMMLVSCPRVMWTIPVEPPSSSERDA